MQLRLPRIRTMMRVIAAAAFALVVIRIWVGDIWEAGAMILLGIGALLLTETGKDRTGRT